VNERKTSLLHECLNQPISLYGAAPNLLQFNSEAVPVINFSIHARASSVVKMDACRRKPRTTPDLQNEPGSASLMADR